jgi:hypothetical protein
MLLSGCNIEAQKVPISPSEKPISPYITDTVLLSPGSPTTKTTLLPADELTSTIALWKTQLGELKPGEYLFYTDSKGSSFIKNLKDLEPTKLSYDIYYPVRSEQGLLWRVKDDLYDITLHKVFSFEPSNKGCEASSFSSGLQYSVISPDLTMIAGLCESYTNGQQHFKSIRLYSLPDKSWRTLMERNENYYSFAAVSWSLDGRWLAAYLSTRGLVGPDPGMSYLGKPDAGLYIFDSMCIVNETKCVHPVTGPFQIEADIDFGGKWSPDSKLIAFYSMKWNGFEIFDVQNKKTSFVWTFPEDKKANGLAWTLDGKSLVYSIPEEDGSSIYQISLINGKTILLNKVPQKRIYYLDWVTIP